MSRSREYVRTRLRDPELSFFCPPCFVECHNVPTYVGKLLQEKVDRCVVSEAPGVFVYDREVPFIVAASWSRGCGLSGGWCCGCRCRMLCGQRRLLLERACWSQVPRYVAF